MPYNQESYGRAIRQVYTRREYELQLAHCAWLLANIRKAAVARHSLLCCGAAVMCVVAL